MRQKASETKCWYPVKRVIESKDGEIIEVVEWVETTMDKLIEMKKI